MHILIFGATGGVGHALVEQALANGDTVTAVTRSPSKLTIKHTHLQLCICDVFDAQQVASLFHHQHQYDAVASCLNTNCGINPGHDLERMMANIVPLLQKYNIKRLVYCASAGVDHELTGERGIAAMEFLKHPLADHRAAINLIRAAQLESTIVRPLGLTNQPMSGTYWEATQGVPTQGIGRIARANVAHFMLKALHDDDYIGQSVALSS